MARYKSHPLRQRKARGGHKNFDMRLLEYLEAEAFESFSPANRKQTQYDPETRYRLGKYNRRASRFEAHDEFELLFEN